MSVNNDVICKITPLIFCFLVDNPACGKYVYNTCAWSKHIGNMCIFYPAMTAFTDQYSLPDIFFDIGQL
jgi:hypothetical protein